MLVLVHSPFSEVCSYLVRKYDFRGWEKWCLLNHVKSSLPRTLGLALAVELFRWRGQMYLEGLSLIFAVQSHVAVAAVSVSTCWMRSVEQQAAHELGSRLALAELRSHDIPDILRRILLKNIWERLQPMYSVQTNTDKGVCMYLAG